MTFRPHPKYSSNDARQGPWSACDVCGFQWNLSKLAWQFDYRGGSSPINTRVLKCPKCMDVMQEQARLLILPPDPAPFMNIRPEAYTVDETNWLTTESGDIIDTQDGKELITSIPNPSDTVAQNTDPVVEEAAVNLITEDGLVLVTEEGDGNPFDYEPNP